MSSLGVDALPHPRLADEMAEGTVAERPPLDTVAEAAVRAAGNVPCVHHDTAARTITTTIIVTAEQPADHGPSGGAERVCTERAFPHGRARHGCTVRRTAIALDRPAATHRPDERPALLSP